VRVQKQSQAETKSMTEPEPGSFSIEPDSTLIEHLYSGQMCLFVASVSGPIISLEPREYFSIFGRAFAHGIAAATGKAGALVAGIWFQHVDNQTKFTITTVCAGIGELLFRDSEANVNGTLDSSPLLRQRFRRGGTV
jgi:hypothetical protein